MTYQTVKPQKVSVDAAEEASPFVVEFFMVRGIDFVCMAYFDENCKWRNAFSHAELYGVTHILE
jgi:hypothetical protein